MLYPLATDIQRILKGSVNPVVRGDMLDQDGEPTTTLAGTLTVNVVDPLTDATVGDTGRVTTAPTDEGDYTQTAALTTAEAADLGIYRVDWIDNSVTRLQTYHSIVGGMLVSRAQLKARKELEGIPTALLDRARNWVQNLVEFQTGAAWWPQFDYYQRTLQDGQYMDRLILPHPWVRSVESLVIDGETQDTDDLDIDWGTGVISGVTFLGTITVAYTHGAHGPPEDLALAAEVAAADVLTRGLSKLSERTRSVTTELGYVQQFSFPGYDHPTGIDFVDQAITNHDHRISGIA